MANLVVSHRHGLATFADPRDRPSHGQQDRSPPKAARRATNRGLVPSSWLSTLHARRTQALAERSRRVPCCAVGLVAPENEPAGAAGALISVRLAPGTWYRSRKDLQIANLHRAGQAGIVGTHKTGAESMVLSGVYEDDEDLGDVIVGRAGIRTARSRRLTLTDRSGRRQPSADYAGGSCCRVRCHRYSAPHPRSASNQILPPSNRLRESLNFLETSQRTRGEQAQGSLYRQI